ncbi:hypothetical protein DSL72_006260 [Monilinia vaccinii-corymbosi]|uniref:BTB domain-containing protein n=1 Tax=Monilinia vaccinii-corymbosi TaxID=61207 RepID=A0A8A3PN88_9HELO|nr:hypothetical protein DSL72_006260 [Monilinia vaccinii-corymbosi]
MATSTSIPQKPDAGGNVKPTFQPIIFQRPGFEIDVRLNVFGQEYLVHSIVLRLQSAYFRTFLDSADKVPAVKSSLFRYDYISVVDNDGEWGLEAVKSTNAKNSSNENTPKLKEERVESGEKLAFDILLRAFYNRPYSFNDYKIFADTYRLADFYCALPAFSCSLDSALLASPRFTSNIEENSVELLRIAKKLHHPVLFRECLVHEVANVSPCDSRNKFWGQRFADDKDLRLAFMIGIWSVREARALADRQILDCLMEAISMEFDRDDLPILFGPNNGYKTAGNYRAVLDELYDDGMLSADMIGNLLRNNLILSRRGDEPRVGGCLVRRWDSGKRFFCAEIRDEDLPWDQDSVDW